MKNKIARIYFYKRVIFPLKNSIYRLYLWLRRLFLKKVNDDVLNIKNVRFDRLQVGVSLDLNQAYRALHALLSFELDLIQMVITDFSVDHKVGMFVILEIF